MNKTIAIIMLTCSFWAISACESGDVKEKISQIDSLQSETDKLELTLNEMDKKFVDDALVLVDEKLNFLQENFKDTLEKDKALIVGDYSRMRRNLNKLKTSQNQQKEMLVYTKKQLVDLKADVKNKLTDEEKYQLYFQTEKESVEKLGESISNLSIWHNSTSKRFAYLDSAINTLIAPIKEKQAI